MYQKNKNNDFILIVCIVYCVRSILLVTFCIPWLMFNRHPCIILNVIFEWLNCSCTSFRFIKPIHKETIMTHLHSLSSSVLMNREDRGQPQKRRSSSTRLSSHNCTTCDPAVSTGRTTLFTWRIEASLRSAIERLQCPLIALCHVIRSCNM